MKIEINTPIKVIPDDNYLLVIEDIDKVMYYFHKRHTKFIDGDDVLFLEGQYSKNPI